MTWEQHSADIWREIISDIIDQTELPIGPALARFNLPPDGFEGQGMIHHGNLRIDGDFTPTSPLTAVFGDLEVTGRVSTQEVAGGDGNATLIVFGGLTCATLVNDWASLILVSQSAKITEWAFASMEDSTFFVGGDFETPLFVGYDIAVIVGNVARMKAGIGYAMGIDPTGNFDTNHMTHPELSWEETEGMLQLAEDDWLDDRFYKTGTILPISK